MPYSAVAPRLINPSLGLHNLVARAGHNAGYDIDLTLLDAPDHRMIRSGVVLAHRVLDGRGEWYLGAPDWVPLLPKERIEPMSHGDLPEELADLVRPFRRRAPLGPVAALSCERREFALRDDRGNTLALVRDDKVTVRRGGLTTARYREVMLTSVGAGLSAEQDAWLATTLGSVGATPVPKFPRLVTRLGAPSTGLTDFPVPTPPQESGSFAQFVAAVLATRLREILQADLAVRVETPGAAARLAGTVATLRRELQGVASALDAGWFDDLDEELAWLAAEAEAEQARTGAPGTAPGSVGRLKTRLRGERYLSLLERLVNAARSPRTREATGQPAGEVLTALLDQGLRTFVDRANNLRRDAPLSAWVSAQDSAHAALRVVEVHGLIVGDRLDRLRGRLATTTALLGAVTVQASVAEESSRPAPDSSPADAFELGRRYEQARQEANAAKQAFVRHWTKTARKIAS